MSVDYIVASLPAIALDAPAPMSWERFCDACGETSPDELLSRLGWPDLETQLRNALAEARKGARFKREAVGCSLYWKNRVLACFQEKDVRVREDLLDRVWWDAAGELTPPSAPLGCGALGTYAVRLRVVIRRSKVSREQGNAAFERLTLCQ